MAELPSVSGTYRFDFDFLPPNPYCDGTDLFSDDTVTIRSDGQTVAFSFANETDDPLIQRYYPIVFEPGRGGIFYTDCDTPVGDEECSLVPNNTMKPLLLKSLECAVSLEGDPAKRAALQQILSVMQVN